MSRTLRPYQVLAEAEWVGDHGHRVNQTVPLVTVMARSPYDAVGIVCRLVFCTFNVYDTEGHEISARVFEPDGAMFNIHRTYRGDPNV